MYPNVPSFNWFLFACLGEAEMDFVVGQTILYRDPKRNFAQEWDTFI